MGRGYHRKLEVVKQQTEGSILGGTYSTDEGRWGSLIALIMFFVFRGSRPGRPPIDDEDFSDTCHVHVRRTVHFLCSELNTSN